VGSPPGTSVRRVRAFAGRTVGGPPRNSKCLGSSVRWWMLSARAACARRTITSATSAAAIQRPVGSSAYTSAYSRRSRASRRPVTSVVPGGGLGAAPADQPRSGRRAPPSEGVVALSGLRRSPMTADQRIFPPGVSGWRAAFHAAPEHEMPIIEEPWSDFPAGWARPLWLPLEELAGHCPGRGAGGDPCAHRKRRVPRGVFSPQPSFPSRSHEGLPASADPQPTVLEDWNAVRADTTWQLP
jgi:hypothetical protein